MSGDLQRFGRPLQGNQPVKDVIRRARTLHVGGRVIRTTLEHPFYARDKGWLECRELEPGDLLCSHDGRWVAVEEVYDSSEYEKVYNLRVADFHTYFVGSEDWSFSVWAHNECFVTAAGKEKILYGEVRGERVVGGHSPRVGERPDRLSERISDNPSGTTNAKLIAATPTGVTRVKGDSSPHTLFPESWSDDKIIGAVGKVGNSPAIAGPRPGDGATTHQGTINGVDIMTIKLPSGEIIAGYPTN
jgi:hypothetical protein